MRKADMDPVVQGGLKLADPEAGNEDAASPLRHTASIQSASLTGGLQAVRRHLSVSNASDTRPAVSTSDPPLAGASGMLQIPHFFWNHLSTATTNHGTSLKNPGFGSTGQDIAWDELFNFEDPGLDIGAGGNEAWAVQAAGGGYSNGNVHQAPPWSVPIATGTSYPMVPMSQGNTVPADVRSDQAAISAALMSFMADMSKSNTQ